MANNPDQKRYAGKIDRDKVQKLAEHTMGILSGAVTSGMIYLGDRLGLYKAMDAAGPLTSDELAAKTGLHERWVREWLEGQATAGLLDYRGERKFELSAEAALVFSNERSPAFLAGGFCSLPQQMGVIERLPESFETGLGLPYDAFGPEGARGIERFLAPWFQAHLVPKALPALDGVVPKLEAGAKVADVGCGAGVALLKIAQAYPHTECHGYDISKHALARAEQNKAEAGVANVSFHDANGDSIPDDKSFDFITTFDCLHDMPNPTPVMQAIYRALKPDGTWLIADIHSLPSFEENLEKNPLAPLLYGFSVMCCMSSAMSTPDGEGLGTLGFSEPVARRMIGAAGFTRFAAHDFDNPINAYFEVRP